MKKPKVQKPAPRAPRQGQARHKVELILEAAIRLLDKGGLPLLTTNAVAELAGVSIGTLYQYFPNKEAILAALTEREGEELSHRVLAVLQDASTMPTEERIGRIVRAVMASYGDRPRVHRQVIEYSLSRGGGRISALIERIIGLLTTQGGPGQVAVPLGEAEAFVLANAFVGVMRAMILRDDGEGPPQEDIEPVLARLIGGFLERAEGAPAHF